MAAYDAVCFDLDLTLCEPTQDPRTLLERAFDRAGCEPFCSLEQLRDAVGSISTAETDREFYRQLFSEAAARVGADGLDPTAVADRYLDLQDPTAVRFRPGAAAALEHARERCRVGLLTNGSRPTQTTKLRTLGIEDAFDVRVFTEPSAGIYPKPDAAPFEYALAAMETTPDAAVHVGDSLRADVAGANAMGLDSAWIPGTDADAEADREHDPTYELSSLEAVESIV